MSRRQLWDSQRDGVRALDTPVNGRSYITMKLSSTTDGPCSSSGHRRCKDGSCIAQVDLCTEEQTVDQNTIFIVVVVGMVVVIVLIVLYCLQQKTRRRSQAGNADQGTSNVAGDGDNASLNMPPPTYDEVITTNLYPPTPEFHRSRQTPAVEEARTPPPNYDAALFILAHSHDSVKDGQRSPAVQRSASTEVEQSRGDHLSHTETDTRQTLSNTEQR